MLNFCKIDLARQIQAQLSINAGDKKNAINNIIDNILLAGRNFSSLTESEKEIYQKDKTEIISWLSEDISYIPQANAENLANFFTLADGSIDQQLYVDVKKQVVKNIVQTIFSSSIYDGTNKGLNLLINSYINKIRNISGYKHVSDPIKHYYNITRAIQTGKAINPLYVADYLIANHFQAVVTNWLPQLVTFDPDTNMYMYSNVHNLDEDWTTEKEPELNIILQLLVENTTIHDYDGEKDIRVPLKPKDFIDSSIEIVKEMSHVDYQKMIEDPYYIIDYLINLYFGEKSTFNHQKFSGNFMKSFINDWFCDEDGDLHRIGQYHKNKANAGHHLYDIIVRSMTKYMSKKYIEYDLDNENYTFDNVPGSYSRAYGQFCDAVNMLDFSAIFDKNGKIRKNVNIDLLAKELFGRYYSIYNSEGIETRRNFRDILLPLIFEFKKSNAEKFQDFIKESDAHSILMEELNYANRFNPFSVSGTVENAAGKPLPVTGLKNVAGDIERNIYELRSRMKKTRKIYNNVNKTTNKQLLIPVSPTVYSALASYSKGNEKNLFIETIYRSTISKTVDGVKIVKEVGEMSSPESFMLSFIEDFYKGWFGNNNTIMFQAITPSDKPLIPFFSWKTSNVKNRYGYEESGNVGLEQNGLKELENIYGQILLNTIIDFHNVLGLNLPITNSAYSKVGFETVQNLVLALNTYLNRINESQLQMKVREFNLINGTNINLAPIHDYNVAEGKIKLNSYLTKTVEMFATRNIDHLYIRFLNSVAQEVGEFTIDDDGELVKIDAKSLLKFDETTQTLGLTQNAKKSPLYTYFLLKMVLGDSILINTVGTPASHKNNVEKQSFEKSDSEGHLTMVKRMVALTATMHSAMKNVLSGMPEMINIVTVPNDSIEMFAYSGNSTEGPQFRSKLKCWDGAMFSTRIASRLLKQSVADTKPEGLAQKLLVHSLDPAKGAATLLKMANFVIDNAFLRKFYIEECANDFPYNPMRFMQMSLENCVIDPEVSIDEDGQLIDYRRRPIFTNYFFKENGIVYKITDISYTNGFFDITYTDMNSGTFGYRRVANNLYALWQGVGGQFSCDSQGNYGEQSQDFIYDLLNKLGASSDSDNVSSQLDVNQYLKSQMTHYFTTVEGSKSLKTPVTNISARDGSGNLINWGSSQSIYKVELTNFGFQLDPDHEADDSTVKEITQLISFIAEGMYVPEHTKKIYGNLKMLLDILSEKTFINIDNIADPALRSQYRDNLDKIFSKKLTRVFSDPNLNVVGLMNEVVRELVLVQSRLKIPYSDGQMLGKSHTSIGSEFNKYISRQWTGRGDVLVPSHNIAMIFEDEQGNTYMADDEKIHTDGNRESIRTYLSNLVWADKQAGIMNAQYMSEHRITAYEVMPTDVYYHLQNNRWVPVTVETWKQLNNIKNDILLNNGIYVRALDRPRNLRSKQVYLDVATQAGQEYKIGMYHLTIMQNIAALGNVIGAGKITTEEELNVVKNILNNLYLSLSEKYKPGDNDLSKEDLDVILKGKQLLQKKFEDEILPAIANGNLSVIESEIRDIIGEDSLQYFEYTFKEEERLTTNNYSSAFGIQNMNFAEISQKKEEYFYEKLVEKFARPTVDGLVPYDYLLYTNKGVPTGLVTDRAKIDNSSFFIEAFPVVNEDGYRIDKHGKPMYKWPEGAKLYKYKVDSIELEVVYVDPSKVSALVEDQTFVFYRTTSENDLLKGTRNLYCLQDGIDTNQTEKTFRRIAKKQYESWKKSNVAIMARIPSQSQAFAMVIKTVGYLPYSNNITMVPNSNVFLEGSDYELL